ncbi:hypothetical protein [Pseudoduganella sp.]|uniref:hypothetical protein n=1 Tax=Pseudoduganella sp. TaxID=1880898 RepID=UPI0035AFFADE
MEQVERILAQVVGEEISAEELALVAGGEENWCTQQGGYITQGASAYGDYCDYA